MKKLLIALFGLALLVNNLAAQNREDKKDSDGEKKRFKKRKSVHRW